MISPEIYADEADFKVVPTSDFLGLGPERSV